MGSLVDTRLEICVQDAAGCRAAARGGADRVELCSALSEGGLTPTLGLLEAALGASELEVVALLRTRRGDFVYDADERAVHLRDAQRLVAAGVHGLAVGALLPSGELDLVHLRALVEAGGSAKLTCHRAFDHCADPFAALEQLIELGFARVLTSGQAPTAPEGQELLAELVQRAAGRIEILAGGGVRPSNVAELVRATGVPAVHSSAARDEPSPMQRRPAVPMGAGAGADEFLRRVTDESTVRSCRRALG